VPEVALVSGGSRGLGLAIAAHLLDGGWSVATFARTTTPELQALEERAEGRLLTARLDATDAAAVAAFVDDAAARLGSVDALVNNAAVGQDSLLAHTAPERVAEIVTTNLVAPILLTRAVVRRMLVQPGVGRIVTIGSVSARTGYPGLTVYSATKAALEGFTRSLARELGGRALVNLIAPGFFASEMSSVLAGDQIASILRRTPTGRLAEPESILPVLDLLLAADSNVNGQVIAVDGGATA
jgi:3-oxoacyl-[acyl-carrier protein] reductase